MMRFKKKCHQCSTTTLVVPCCSTLQNPGKHQLTLPGSQPAVHISLPTTLCILFILSQLWPLMSKCVYDLKRLGIKVENKCVTFLSHISHISFYDYRLDHRWQLDNVHRLSVRSTSSLSPAQIDDWSSALHCTARQTAKLMLHIAHCTLDIVHGKLILVLH